MMLSRRRLMQIGGLGAFSLNLPQLLRAEAVRSAAAASAPREAKRPRQPIRSCILIFYYGGPSHHDMWDMKPGAPKEVRGEFQGIDTAAPGLRLSEHLPHTARVADKIAVVRSLHHPMTNHNAAAFEALCGRTPLKGDLELLANDRNDAPCHGSAINYLLPAQRGLPSFVALPHVMYNVVMLPGQQPGFLGSAYGPLQVARDPNAPDFHLGELELPGEISLARLEDRESLLRVVDAQLGTAEALATATGADAYTTQAFDLLRSPQVRTAFDIAHEDPRLRDRYGRTKHGQSLLLARRLVQAGVRFVCVFDHETNGMDNWDTHNNNFGRLKDSLLPPIDRGYGALVTDLAQRGLLESTLVISMGEFGRTPRLNNQSGRDHWPYCYSALLAGGGVAGGSVYGSSDKLGAYPDSDGVTPGDLAATIFWRFGLDPTSELRDLNNRPYRLAEGSPLARLFNSTA